MNIRLRLKATTRFRYTQGEGKMKRFAVCLAAIVLILSCGSLFAAVVTFDDLPSSSAPQPIPEDYSGFNWTNFGYVDPLPFGPSGYANGTVSPTNVAYNRYGDPSMLSSGSFEFVGAYFTGAWNDGLNVSVSGYLNGEVIERMTIVTSYYVPTWSSFNWVVDQLSFNSYGGTLAPEAVSDGLQFVMDNFTYNVPEPGTMFLFGLGGLILRKRK